MRQAYVLNLFFDVFEHAFSNKTYGTIKLSDNLRKEDTTMLKVGDLVQTDDISYPGVPGVLVYYNQADDTWLVRYGVNQDFYATNRITPWDK